MEGIPQVADREQRKERQSGTRQHREENRGVISEGANVWKGEEARTERKGSIVKSHVLKCSQARAEKGKNAEGVWRQTEKKRGRLQKGKHLCATDGTLLWKDAPMVTIEKKYASQRKRSPQGGGNENVYSGQESLKRS